MATLGFSTKWPKHMGGGDTEFVQKIWEGLPVEEKLRREWIQTLSWHGFEVYENGDYIKFIPKLHTIRFDPHNLWVPGRKIHMVIFNRSKNRFQFAPVLEVKSVQTIQIAHEQGMSIMFIDGEQYDIYHFGLDDIYEWPCDILELAKNDGFNSVEHFFQWFNTDTKPNTKIIHWTDLKY